MMAVSPSSFGANFCMTFTCILLAYCWLQQHGSVLIRHPSSIAREEESEASSLSVENKHYSANEAYSRSVNLPIHNDYKGENFSSRNTDKAKNFVGQAMQHDQLKRDKCQHEKFQILGNHNSLLCDIDISDVLNFDEFVGRLTNEEQQQLLKYIPLHDTAEFPDSLKNMFDSFQFKENISSFQKLLAEGVFDLSFPGAATEDCKTLKRLALSNLTIYNWVEHYHSLKKCKSGAGGSYVPRGLDATASNNIINIQRLRDIQNQKFPEANKRMKSPKRVTAKTTYENNEFAENDRFCYSPRCLFASPSDSSSLMLESLHFVDESPDQDLLLDVPSNGIFPQAELLHTSLCFGQQASSSSSVYPNHAQT